MKIFIGLFLFFNLSLVLGVQRVEHVQLTATVLDINKKTYLAITLKNDEHWHTYWKNPGDAGLPPKFKFLLNGEEIKLHGLEWPSPKRYIEKGNLLTYGYVGTYSFFFGLTENDIETLKNKTLQLKGEWLVCEAICIPGRGELDIIFQNDGKTVRIQKTKYQISKKELRRHFKNLPVVKEKIPDHLELFFSKGDNEKQLKLYYTYKVAKADIQKDKNLLFPFPALPLSYRREKLAYDTRNQTYYGLMNIDWDGEYQEPEWPLPEDGVFKKSILAKFLIQSKDGPFIIQKEIKQFSLAANKTIDQYMNRLMAEQETVIDTSPDYSIWWIILFAFLGGLILNLMPCVLPVISIKLFGLILHRDEPHLKILKHNLTYTLGVVFTFFLMGLIVVGLKSVGSEIGWGFQLQSPPFVFIMLIILFIMSLNLFGLFEFGTPGGKTLGGKQLKSGFGADFFAGVLATILSTPCSAPFLGTALTFAFTTTNLNIFITFFFVGIGLSSPFILTGIFPKLVSFLPKPGQWIEMLKRFLGLSLVLTFVWLYDVLVNLVDFTYSGIYINTIFALLFFAIYYHNRIGRGVISRIIFYTIPLVLAIYLFQTKGLSPNNINVSSYAVRKGELNWERWSEKKMNQLKYEGKLVFVDFTAKWCLTCKVNKKIVLESDTFSQFVKDNNIHLLRADWTKRDDRITRFLRKHRIVGVPAYFLINRKGEIKSLGEIISTGKIKDNL